MTANHATSIEPLDRSRELMVLTTVAAVVAQSLELQPLLVTALDYTLDLMGLDAGAIWVGDDSAKLTLAVQRGLVPQAQDYRHETVLLPLLSRMSEREPLVIHDVQTIPGPAFLLPAELRAMVALPLKARGAMVGVLAVFQTAPLQWSVRTISLLEAIADHVALGLDNARLYAAEQQRRRQSEALRLGALALTEAFGLDDMLGRIVEQAISLMEAPMCTVYEQDAQAHLQVRISRGFSNTAAPTAVLQPGEQAVSEAIHSGQTVAYHDRAACRSVLTATELELPYNSLLAAPLVVKGHHFGGIVVYVPQERQFTSEEQELLRIFADQAALALEHAQLVEQSRQLAAMEERQRLARDLHDSVSQTLFSLKLAAQAAQTTLQVQPDEAAGLLTNVQELATGALAEMRALIFELRPTALQEAGLAAALQRQTAAFTARTRVMVELSLDEQRCPAPIEEALYRIAGEALANIGRHARATAVTVVLRVTDTLVRLVITDNGQGFDLTAAPLGDHLGQRTMRERASALGGTCWVTSTPGQGTLVTVELPR